MTAYMQALSAAQKTFAKIGKSNGSAPPEDAARANNFTDAYELAIAQTLKSVAEKRYEAAKEAAEKSGVLGDPAKYIVGLQTVASYESFDVQVQRNNDSETLDKTLLLNELTKRYDRPTAEAIVAAASKPRKGATTIKISMKV